MQFLQLSPKNAITKKGPVLFKSRGGGCPPPRINTNEICAPCVGQFVDVVARVCNLRNA